MEHPTAMPLWSQGAPGNLEGTPDDQPILELYLPEHHDSPRGLVIVLPGGAYVFRAGHEGGPVAEYLCQHGIAAAVVQYRVAPHRYPVPAEDARRAIRLARAHAQEWNILPDHIGILGFSAGGHCAATAATIHQAEFLDAQDPIDRESSRPDALVACYPVITLGELAHQGSVHNLLDDAAGKVDSAMKDYLSLENRVTPDTPPTFIWSTFTDQGVPVENTLMFAQALHRCCVPCECHVFAEGHHGLGLAQQQPGPDQWPELCVSWLKRLGF